MTAARVPLLSALDRIDGILKAQRRPISRARVDAAILAHRVSFPKWSPRHRSQARWDIETELEAAIAFARTDWCTIVMAHKAGALFDDTGSPHPSEYYRLPSERKAAAALNALRHASISRRDIVDTIRALRASHAATCAQEQSEGYRRSWREVVTGTIDTLRARMKQRRRDWSTFLRLLAEYRALAS